MVDRSTIARTLMGRMHRPGNIDPMTRPMIWNPDGSGGCAAVRSMSFDHDGRTVLVPTVSEQGLRTPDQAIGDYERTGQHLGIFNDRGAADAYARRLHEDQYRDYFGASWAGP